MFSAVCDSMVDNFNFSFCKILNTISLNSFKRVTFAPEKKNHAAKIPKFPTFRTKPLKFFSNFAFSYSKPDILTKMKPFSDIFVKKITPNFNPTGR